MSDNASGHVNFFFKAYDNASSTMNKVKGSMLLLSNSITQLGGGFESVGSIMQGFAAGGVSGAVSAAVGEIITVLQEAIQTFAEFETALVDVTSASGLTGDALVVLTDELIEAAKVAGVDFGVGATKAMEALESLIKAGLEGEEAIAALEAALALATVESISTADAADMLVGIMGMFKMAAEEAAHATDVLVNASMLGIGTASEFATGLAYVGGRAEAMGFSLEETTAALVAMNNQGINAASAGQYLNQMFTALIQKSDQLGFSIYDAQGEMLSLAEISGNLTDKLNSFSNAEERNAYLTEIFGARAGIAATALIGLGESGDEVTAALLALTAGMDESGSAMDVVDAKAETLAGTQARLDAMMQNLQLTIGEGLAPIVMAFSDFMEHTFIPALEWLIGVFGAIGDALAPVITFFDNLRKIIGSRLQPVIEDFIEFLGPIIEVIIAFAEAVGAVVDAIMEGLGAIGDALDDAANEIDDSLDDIEDSVDDITDILDELTDASADAGRDFRDDWRYNRDSITDDIDDIVDDIERLGDVIQELGDTGLGIDPDATRDKFNELNGIVTNFTNNLSKEFDDLAADVARTWDEIVGDTTNAITDGLLGDAQDAIHDFVNCSTTKQAEMVDDIDGYLNDLQKSYDENVNKIAELIAAGNKKEAAMLIKKNEEIKKKMLQLEEWRNALIQDSWDETSNIIKKALNDQMNMVTKHSNQFQAVTDRTLIEFEKRIDIGDLERIIELERNSLISGTPPPAAMALTTPISSAPITNIITLEFTEPITPFDAQEQAQAIMDALRILQEEQARQRWH